MSTATARRVLLWPLLVRVTHGCVAGLVLFNLFNESGAKLHRYAGYAAAGFVLLRTVYGFTTRNAAARLHWPTPRACMAHLRDMLGGRPERVAGHNPLGAAMSLLLWSLILLLAASGWISRLDRFWGEDWPVDFHESVALVLQVCIVLHLLGVVASSLLERQNLAWSMVTGRKTVDHPPARDSRPDAVE